MAVVGKNRDLHVRDEEREWEEFVRREGGGESDEGSVVKGGGSGDQSEEGNSDQREGEDSHCPSSLPSSAGAGGT